MAAGVSRRRLLATAATLAAAAALGGMQAVTAAEAQALTPQQALERLFGAAPIDPSWFSPAVLQSASPAQIQQQFGGLHGLFGAFRAVQAQDDGSFLVQFAGGTVRVRVALDDQGRIASLRLLQLDYALAPDEQEVQFQSNGDTLYGTLLLPAGVTNAPAALLIAGSGPTDRNGNSPLLSVQVNTLAGIARALAGAGVASLRYDKFGAGKTGTAGHAPTDFGFDGFVAEALAAWDTLAARPEIDASRLLPAGHSEGALFALLVAQQRQAQTPPAALLLAAPLGRRILDVLRRQIVAQADAALASGAISQARHDALIADLDRTIASIRQDGTVPPDAFADEAQLRASLFPPGAGPFLQTEDGYDPALIAAALPPALPVLLLHGALDLNVDDGDIQHLLAGFQAAGNAGVLDDEFPDVDHELREAPPGGRPSLAVALPFSPDVAAAITAFAGALSG
ncbi:MAG TPA: alpha/beta hydrolase [Dehalococcoidia bacterium]|nr:alpha/beta hydrolase [Dehalococcoidia bacterium]